MRVIIGMILGAGLTLGAAFFHDNNVPETPTRLVDRPIVNWDVLGAIVNQNTAFLRRLWNEALPQ